MAKVPQAKELEAYNFKTIQPGNWFILRFLGKNDDDESKEIQDIIKPYVVNSISVQEPVSFDKTGYHMQGRPFARPVMKPCDGYEFSVKMEETDDWQIQQLIHILEKRNIRPDGTHTGLTESNLGEIEVCSLSPRGYLGKKSNEWSFSMKWTFKDCFFVSANSIDFSYDSPRKITRDLTFCCSAITRESIDYKGK